MYALEPSLFSSEPSAPVRLFFSIFPDSPAAARIAQVAQDLRRRYGLRGRPLLTARFHCSLCCLDDCDGAAPALVAKVREAAALVTATAFRVSFNCAKSFSGGDGRYALVLTGEDGVIGLTMLYSSLCTAMRAVGFPPRGCSSFTPHVTMLYDRCRIDEQSIEPICWTVGEFVLVLSLIGKTRHVPLGRWQLCG